MCVSTSSKARQDQLRPSLGDILPVLFHFADASEDSMRNLAAECLGKLAVLYPATVLPEMKKQTLLPSPAAGSTAGSANFHYFICFIVTFFLLLFWDYRTAGKG